ncbi:Rpn family recombination-promoting nuclease/putative transposase [Pannus brasiliensis CCIBt3594]|uniref:Rpn family recombination-promoting nuclease/putative transposase n=1 Tax=Pannus brasiliensis CCIBt3594 TaxID=1427578 RepID=A0AAW9QX48_9CHRO
MFDNICKFIAENFRDDLATWLLGSPVPLNVLDPAELAVDPIRADSLIFLQSEQLILHTEFQTAPDPDIPFRMLDYRVRLHRRHPRKEARQVVIYLRPTDSPLVRQDSFHLRNTSHTFEVIRLWEQPTESFFSLPGLLPFAVLSDTDNPEQVLTRVSRSLESLSPNRVKSNLAAASSILAGLVLNREIIDRILRSDIMRESVIYQRILEEGREEGREEGEARGREEKARQIARKMFLAGFSIEEIARLTDLSPAMLEDLQRQSRER